MCVFFYINMILNHSFKFQHTSMGVPLVCVCVIERMFCLTSTTSDETDGHLRFVHDFLFLKRSIFLCLSLRNVWCFSAHLFGVVG